jgi:hypothetical protein
MYVHLKIQQVAPIAGLTLYIIINVFKNALKALSQQRVINVLSVIYLALSVLQRGIAQNVKMNSLSRRGFVLILVQMERFYLMASVYSALIQSVKNALQKQLNV